MTEIFGNVAHRFSGYTKRGTLDGTAFEWRGAIATQLVRTTGGWRMSAMAWDDEREGLTVPGSSAVAASSGPDRIGPRAPAVGS